MNQQSDIDFNALAQGVGDAREALRALAQGVGDAREALRALVAGFVAEGFTDEQARDITAGMFRSLSKDDE